MTGACRRLSCKKKFIIPSLPYIQSKKLSLLSLYKAAGITFFSQADLLPAILLAPPAAYCTKSIADHSQLFKIFTGHLRRATAGQ
jgi:hypothetical protein